MSEVLVFGLTVLGGMLLGVMFFGGLWWTVQKGLSLKQSPLWFSISLLLRLGITLVGFYFVAGADWKRLLACLAGFFIVRIIVTRLTAI